ncbi:MAG: 4Fe-4S ferredoxin [Phormidesmis priestleyi Ana]|uniref:4Fe-4S ferredoxin n=1 Tax=Phormidesmis priestleyi Ana TaxID=1666911 RepID=A0A0P7YSS0_9CYAN|nr:MAG: 4Fe-4S ferredoxin [Phormidesmis priestleyi Ana]
MTYTVKDNCISCDICQPQCPNGAIKADAQKAGYWIDPTLCDGCPDLEVPLCVQSCEVDALAPLQPKKGRCKSTLLPVAIPTIFLNRKTTPFASCMVMWETCNILAQRQSLPWQTDTDDRLCYQRPVNRNRGEMRFRLAADPEIALPVPLAEKAGMAAIAQFDIRASCVHLIFAAYAMTIDRPWQESFVLNDQHIEKYLGLDRRKDLSKLEKLTLIKNLVYQSCQVLVSLDWPRQGRVRAFSLKEHAVWNLLDTQYYFEENAQGDRHLIGLGFTVKAGQWAKHFLNKHEYRGQTAFYQYGTLPQALLKEVMNNWQQHEGAVRLLLWNLFKLRLGGDQRMKASTLMRIAYGADRLQQATVVRGAHKRLLKTFESDLETIYYHGLKPLFDPITYPLEIQPLWVKMADIPDDVDDALNFWADEAGRALTENAPRDKWQRILNARLLGFELSEEWQENVQRRTTKRRHRQAKAWTVTPESQKLSGQDINVARQRQKLSQRALAERLGKSQSWIRDVEKGRFKVNGEDQSMLRQVLDIR